MRHRKGGFKLQRDPSGRRALLRGLTTSVILEDRIVTTVTKAKAVRPQVEKMITLAKRDTLHSRRKAAAYLQSPEAVQKLFDQLGPKFADRPGGYTRIMRVGFRKGDGAEEAIIELIGADLKKRAEERRKRREERLKQHGLTTSVILEDRIVTTVTKAKAVRPQVEKMITLAKRDTLHSRRKAAAYLQSPEAVQKLFDQLGPKFADRPGGYTRIMRVGFRKGDGAEEAIIELIGADLKKRAEERRKRREERLKQQEEEGGEAAE